MNHRDPVAVHAPATVSAAPEATRWVDPRAALRPTIRAFRAEVNKHTAASRSARVDAREGASDAVRFIGQSVHARTRVTLRALTLLGGFLRGREYARMENTAGVEVALADLGGLTPAARDLEVARRQTREASRKAAFRKAASVLSDVCTANPELAGYLAACGVVGTPLPSDADERAYAIRSYMDAWRKGMPLGVTAA